MYNIPTMKKIILLAALFLLASQTHAIKVENLHLNGDLHLGIVNGPGMGIYVGLDAGLKFDKLEIGAEAAKLMTDVNYSATISATRYGLVLGLRLSDIMKLNLHKGAQNFEPSRDIAYKDASGKDQMLLESVNYYGDYWAISLDYQAWDYIISPKYVLNNVADKGSVQEIDLLIGKSF